MAKDDDIKRQIVSGVAPNSGRFAKGKSGNPRGRPKKRKSQGSTDSSVRDQFLKAAEALMRLTENGKDIQIPVHEAIGRSEILTAMKGSSHAQRNFIARYERYCRERAEEIEENHKEWRQYISAYNAMVKDFADRGEPLPDYYPHPDELVFTEGKFVTGWLGQRPSQGAILRAHYIRVRDVFLLQAEKDRRHFGTKNELEHASTIIALFINALLLEAVQLDEVTLMIRFGQQRSFPKREIQQRLTAAWTELGSPKARDLTTPPLDGAAKTRVLNKFRERLALHS